MIQDPYRVLGLNENASDDEVKVAYRKLAKKYHPDVNQGNAQAEARMKEINEAYDQIIHHKTGSSSAGQSSWGGYGGYGGFGGFGGYGGYGGTGGAQWQDEFAGGGAGAEYSAVRSFLRSSRWYEAMSLLNRMQPRGAAWYYYAAVAQNGLGNRVAALNFAQTAVQMDPTNPAYQQLLNQLSGWSSAYTTRRTSYGQPTLNMQQICFGLCLLNACCPWCRCFIC